MRRDEVVNGNRGYGAHDREEGKRGAGEKERRAQPGGRVSPRRQDVRGREPGEDDALPPGGIPARGGRRRGQDHGWRLAPAALS